MSAPSDGTVLKRNIKRTVRVEHRAGGGAPRVVKRFHAPFVLDRLRDGWRARREFGRLQRARARGLPVPEPIEVRKRQGRWELVIDYLPHTLELAQLVDGRAPWPAPPGRVAVELGRLLARMSRLGIDHADLHVGNALIDRGGRPWLVDLAHCRARGSPSCARLRATLVRLASGVREHLPESFRARFLLAFLGGLPEALRAGLPPAAALAAAIEDAARLERRAEIRTRVARWTRDSGAVAPFGGSGWHGFLRRDLAHAEAPPPEALEREGGRFAIEAQVLRRWETAARLTMHDVPCARPVCILMAPRRRALFELPRGSRPLAALREDAPRSTWRALGALVGRLHDRGLCLREWGSGDVFADAGGRLYLSPAVSLTELDAASPRARGARLASLAESVGSPARQSRAAFLAGYLQEQRHSRAERRRLRGELGG